jgi:hypothetical protein
LGHSCVGQSCWGTVVGAQLLGLNINFSAVCE